MAVVHVALKDLFYSGGLKNASYSRIICLDGSHPFYHPLYAAKGTRCHGDLPVHVRKVTMTDHQLVKIEAFCAKIRNGVDQADFNTRRQIIEQLDVRGKIAFENGEKVIYL